MHVPVSCNYNARADIPNNPGYEYSDVYDIQHNQLGGTYIPVRQPFGKIICNIKCYIRHVDTERHRIIHCFKLSVKYIISFVLFSLPQILDYFRS
jgi:hypothetical protein